jgi:hypothetical protein
VDGTHKSAKRYFGTMEAALKFHADLLATIRKGRTKELLGLTNQYEVDEKYRVKENPQDYARPLGHCSSIRLLVCLIKSSP